MKLPKVSIIVPIYNVEQYIEDCLASIAAQTYSGNLECILVDDCGTDRSIDISKNFVNNYKGNIEFTILHHQRNRGLSAARNTGLEYSSGEYVYFLDSDDEITKDCIEKLAKPLESFRYDIVVGDFIVTGFNAENFPVSLKLDNISLYGKDIMESYCKDEIYMMAWNKLCNKNFLCKHNLYFKEGLIHEDELWSFEVNYEASSLAVVKSKSYVYKLRQNSITTNNTIKRKTIALLTIMEGMLQRLNFSNQATINTPYYKILSLAYSIMPLAQKTGDERFIRETYTSIRKIVRPYLVGFNIKFHTPRKILRDLHFYVPEKLGLLLIKVNLYMLNG